VAERISTDTIGGPFFQAPETIQRHQDGGSSSALGSTPRVWDTSTPTTGPLFRRRMTSLGKLRSTAPSTSTWPFITTGGMTPGMEIEARRAWRSIPSRCTSTLPDVRLVETAKKGRGMSSIFTSP